jgi:hypothetical protein
LPRQSESQRARVGPALPTKTFICFVLLTAIFAGQALSQDQQTENHPGRIQGTVINAITNQPIGRALVHSSDNRLATLTNSEGHFEFALGADGVSPWLMARKPGFLEDPRHNMTQVEASPDRDITISLMPEALIKGRVILSTGDAAADVTIQIFSHQVMDGALRWIEGVSTRANSNGEFRFAELLPGDYKLITHEWMDNDPLTAIPGGQVYGFPPVYYPNATDFAAAGTIHLSAGETFQADVSLVSQPYFQVTIPVTNAQMNSGLNLTVSPQGRRGPGYSLGYNPQRQRIEGLLPNGNYLVEALSYGESPSNGAVSIAVAGAPLESPSMVMARNGSISLNVKEEFPSTNSKVTGSGGNGRRSLAFQGPRTYLQVGVETADDFAPQSGGSLRDPTGPNDDSLVIEKLPPGRYRLLLHSSRGYIASATMGGVDLLRQPLVIGQGSSAPMEITVRDDTAEIEGTVAGISHTADGIPPISFQGPAAWVYSVPLPDSPGQFQQIGISPQGTFNSQIAPGDYRVMAFKHMQPNFPYRDADAMRAYETKGQLVHLSPGQKATVQLQIVSSSE